MTFVVPEWVTTVMPWAISAFGVACGIIVARINKSGVRENLILDQVQEERNVAVEHLREARKEMREERTEMRNERAEIKIEREEMRAEREDTARRLAEIERRQQEVDAREAAAHAYIGSLRDHITEGRPPPPPEPPNRLVEWLSAHDWVDSEAPE